MMYFFMAFILAFLNIGFLLRFFPRKKTHPATTAHKEISKTQPATTAAGGSTERGLTPSIHLYAFNSPHRTARKVKINATSSF